jgi:hypothetical protein
MERNGIQDSRSSRIPLCFIRATALLVRTVLA